MVDITLTIIVARHLQTGYQDMLAIIQEDIAQPNK